MARPAIELVNITKIFNKLSVLENISLTIHEGEFFIFVGPSGSGKSTLLRIMSGLEKDYKGKVTLGADFSLSDISFVFQQFALLPWLTVWENIEMGLVARRIPPDERASRIKKELTQLGLGKFAHVFPRELSGGMRQRVGIARALVTEPKIIFMDEPFSELDSFTAEELRQEILSIWAERKITIVMVTHIIPEALELADEIAVLTARPARIERVVTNEMTRPRQKRSPEFYRLEDMLYKIIKP